MRRITLWLFSTVVAVVLLFSFRTSTNSPAEPSAARATVQANAPTTTPTTGAAPTTPTTGATPSPSTGSSAAATTYTGSVAPTRWGDVQVAITVTGGRITDVTVPVYPTENHKDEEINAYALPVLRQETLDAQNADIDTVSGATVTSDGYLQSLQSALDAAHLG